MKNHIIIRKATIDDAEGKGYVHYHSWNEAYTGLIDQNYLDSRTLTNCVETARKYPQNTYVALFDDKIVGFACYLKCRDDDLEDTGEINAIYVLKKYYGLGIGKQLMNMCFKELREYSNISLWVLKTNSHAIKFYEHIGFEKDGKEKTVNLNNGSSIVEIRMTLDIAGLKIGESYEI
ncbi:GNAT family N-acetyltransferase [Candidatus Xianfuyuplasma coldseepsis]|uniref:GNAT family N-acetyltransferase n=1 Tax=Candidatus Xianfuyuplasma coldseepsis TaxID=2782163 RepID=A0A7L7KU15_9MOLU|nr:GNAT family N-acetyltransferase [Xianfuyuplasma coldseepsis]QMS85268.1 GNAT family N-acetyltransferase [Xianfuyuplasma coldseepsis]